MPDFYTWLAWAIAILAFVVGAQVLGPLTLLVILVLVAVLLIATSATLGRRARSRLVRAEPRFQRTDEVFRDPASGVMTRVHVDPKTGERRYVSEE